MGRVEQPVVHFPQGPLVAVEVAELSADSKKADHGRARLTGPRAARPTQRDALRCTARRWSRPIVHTTIAPIAKSTMFNATGAEVQPSPLFGVTRSMLISNAWPSSASSTKNSCHSGGRPRELAAVRGEAPGIQRLRDAVSPSEMVRAASRANCVVERGRFEELTSHWLWRFSISNGWDRESIPEAS
jgi:hypothetical protein